MKSVIQKIAGIFLAIVLSLPLSAQKVTSAMGESTLISAVNFYDKGDYVQAERLLRAIVLECPQNDAAIYYMGLCRLMQNDIENAVKYLNRAVELDGKNYWYRNRLAAVYAWANSGDVAVKMYEDILKDFPEKNDIYYTLLDLYSHLHRYNDALSTLDRMETALGVNESTVMARFDLLRSQGKNIEAFECLREFNRQYTSVKVLSMLGDYEMTLYNDSTAVAYYNEALSIEPDYLPARIGRVESYRLCRKYDQFFPEASSIMADEAVPAAGKAYYLDALLRETDPRFQRNYRDQLNGVFEVALEAHPADSAILRTSGIYFLSAGDSKLAEKCFADIIDVYPNDSRPAFDYCSLLAYQEKWDELIAASESFIYRYPDGKIFYEYVIAASYNKGDFDKVLARSQKLADESKTKEEKVIYMSTMVDIYHMQGNVKKTFAMCKKCLKLDPDNILILNNYAYYLSLEGKSLKKAYQMSRKTIDMEPDNATYLDTYGWILYLQKKYPEAKGIFKHAMLYGGKDSATILDHYAEVLFAMKDYDSAFYYWNLAVSKADASEKAALQEKLVQRKAQIKK